MSAANRKLKKMLGRMWIPAVVLLVAALLGYAVNTVRAMSEAISHPPTINAIPATVIQVNPKHVTYEVFGELGDGGRVAFANLNSEPIEVVLTSLPWSHSETTMSPAATLSLVAQIKGNALGCRIIVNGEVRDEQFVAHENAAVSCTVTAA